jgi:hypothetical protein
MLIQYGHQFQMQGLKSANVLIEPCVWNCSCEVDISPRFFEPQVGHPKCISLESFSLPLGEGCSCLHLTEPFCLDTFYPTLALNRIDQTGPIFLLFFMSICGTHVSIDHDGLSRTRIFRCLEWSLLVPAGPTVDVSSCYQRSPGFTNLCSRRWPPRQEKTALLNCQPSPRPSPGRTAQFDGHNTSRDRK